jgi:hypothetical protein
LRLPYIHHSSCTGHVDGWSLSAHRHDEKGKASWVRCSVSYIHFRSRQPLLPITCGPRPTSCRALSIGDALEDSGHGDVQVAGSENNPSCAIMHHVDRSQFYPLSSMSHPVCHGTFVSATPSDFSRHRKEQDLHLFEYNSSTRTSTTYYTTKQMSSTEGKVGFSMATTRAEG